METASRPTPPPPDTRPNERTDGPVVAAMLAAGISAVVLAALVVAAEASESFAASLQYSDRVGPLGGKAIWASVAFFGSWALLALALRRRAVDLGKAAAVTALLVAVALVGTFAPFFQLFAPE